MKNIAAEHSRAEHHICRQLRVTEWIIEAGEWNRLQTIVEMERERYLPESSVLHKLTDNGCGIRGR